MPEGRVQRRLAAILASDVVGYTRLMREDEVGTLAQLKALRRDILEPKVEEYGGRIVKTTGDGMLVEFPSAVDAVQHAVDIQRMLARRQSGPSDDRRIELRIGINVGDVIIDGDDLYGDGVNIAARLESMADPGGILISGAVHEQVRTKLELDFDDQGERSVKNIAEPIRMFQVLVRAHEAPADAAVASTIFQRPAVAVLPFENLSNDPDQDYFVDGLTEDIITALSLWRSFPVIARNSSFAYKGQSPDIRKVGNELGARYIVEGSVRRSGERVRVTAQLINAKTGHHIWAERYDRDLQDIFALQDEITEHIAAIVEPAIERTEQKRIVAKPPNDLAAWEFWLRGYAHIYEETEEANEKAREMFHRAIEVDPHFSRAYTGLAYTYVKDLRFFRHPDREGRLELLFESARRAIALDESDAEARTMLVRAYVNSQQPEAAIEEARRAVELNPHNAFANSVLGVALSWAGARYEEGIPWLERALRLNPLDPQRHLLSTHLALATLCAGRYETAEAQANDAIRRRPDFLEARVVLASVLGYMGRTEQAQKAVEALGDGAGDFVEAHPLLARQTKDLVMTGLRKAGWDG